MGIILELLEYINVKSKSLLEYIYMRINLYLLEYIHENNPTSIRDIMVKSRSIHIMVKRGRNIIKKVEKYLKKGNNLDQNSCSQSK
jgi:hypothetical protein